MLFSPSCRELNFLQKRYTALLHRTNTFSENKIIRSVVGRKVDSQILFGARSKKPKIVFAARGEKRKNLFGAKWQLRKNVFSSKGLRLHCCPIKFIILVNLNIWIRCGWTINQLDLYGLPKNIHLLFRTKSSATSRAFSVAAPKLWNNLLLDIRNSKIMSVFRKLLKTYLYKQAYKH